MPTLQCAHIPPCCQLGCQTALTPIQSVQYDFSLPADLHHSFCVLNSSSLYKKLPVNSNLFTPM